MKQKIEKNKNLGSIQPDHQILDIQALGIPEIAAIGKYRSFPVPKQLPAAPLSENMYQLVYIDKNEHQVFLDGKLFSLKGGQFFTVKAGQTWRIKSSNKTSLYWITGYHNFSYFLGCSSIDGIKIINHILYKEINIKNNLNLTTLFRKIFHFYQITMSLEMDQNIYINRLRYLIFEIFFHLYQTIRTSGSGGVSKQTVIATITSFIEKNLHRPIELQELAQHTGLSIPYLRFCFREILRISLRNFINLKRIELAQTLLVEKKSIIEIASLLHFSSPQYFATVFKKYTGQTPSQYITEKQTDKPEEDQN